MNFEVSERLTTRADRSDILHRLEEKFKMVALNVRISDQKLLVDSIEASFGSINRSDTTQIELREHNEGYLLLASVNYRPSFAFWIILLLTLFSGIFWVIPIVFYSIQKDTVRNSIQNIFVGIKHEFSGSLPSRPPKSLSNLDMIAKLGELRNKGHISEEEFQQEKTKLLSQ